MKPAETVTPTELLARLAEGNGTVQVPDPEPAVRAGYRRAIHRILVEQLVPAGKALRHSGRDRGDLTIRLVATDPAGTVERPPKLRVPAALDGAPADIAALARAGALPGFSPAGWERALLILYALAEAASQRGVGFAVRQDGDIVISITLAEDSQDFLLTEELERRNVPDETGTTVIKYDWQRVPTRPTLVPTGRLLIRTPERYGAKSWADRRRWRLEDKLGDVLAFAEQRCQEATSERRRAEAYDREQRRIWDDAVPRAHAQYVDQLNRERLDTQVQAWRRAQDYRHYAAELQRRSSAAELDDTARAGLTGWIAFIEEQAAHLDPLEAVEELRVVTPEAASATDLDRFMPSGMTVLRPPSPAAHRPPAR